jgi:hypothetical protein
MTSLGPAYIKLGQALSIRPDLLSPAAMNELQKLCDKVPSFDSKLAMKVSSGEVWVGVVWVGVVWVGLGWGRRCSCRHQASCLCTVVPLALTSTLMHGSHPWSTAPDNLACRSSTLQLLEEELGAPWQKLFATLTPEPIAAASLGQVYKGTLSTGESVAVKVQMLRLRLCSACVQEAWPASFCRDAPAPSSRLAPATCPAGPAARCAGDGDH